jgi:hypothetical protein
LVQVVQQAVLHIQQLVERAAHQQLLVMVPIQVFL